MFKDYYEVRDWLETFIPLVYGKEELGLVRIEYLLNLLGGPERKFKSIHVAGTSGKGSTAFYIARLLEMNAIGNSPFAIRGEKQKAKSKKRKIGLHISPHLVDIRERMQIIGGTGESEDRRNRRNRRIGRSEEPENRKIGGGENLMPMGRFLKLFEQVRPVVEKIQKEKPELTPSYFEILVAASFKYFAEENVDWAVVEVGLGGRLDATNVLMPEVSVITNIGLDHTEILGDTIEKIAREKAGIIKTKVSNVSKVSQVSNEGIPVVTGATGAALRVIEKVAKEKKASLYSSSETRSFHKNYDNSIGKFSLRSNSNLELAMKAVEVALGFKSDLIRNILSKTQGSTLSNLALPGRFEEIEQDVILDGAHNPDKIQSLIEFVRNKEQETGNKKQISPKSIILVLAFKKGKNWKEMVDMLVKNLPIKQIIATEFQAVTDTGKFGAVSGKEIKDYLDTKYKIPDTKYYLNSQEAVFLTLTSNTYKTNQLVLVTGSLYLVGEVRTMWELPSFD